MEIKIIILAILTFLISQFIYSQNVTEKFLSSFDLVDLIQDDSVIVGTLSTHSNIDIYDAKYLSLSSSERVYHFIVSNSSAYKINRLTYTLNENKMFISDFKLFQNEGIKLEFSGEKIRIKIINTNKSLIFYNNYED